MRNQFDFEDIQAIIFSGYGELHLARYVFMQIRDPERAKQWLGWLWAQVKTAAALREEKRQSSEAKAAGAPSVEEAPRCTMHVAFSVHGLRALGLPEEVLETFSREFVQGMAHPDRSQVLGDTGKSAPEHWKFGGPDPRKEIHLVLMLFTQDDRKDGQSRSPFLERLYKQAKARAGGLKVIHIQDAHLSVIGGRGLKAPLGFSDGISQPEIEGFRPPTTHGMSIKAGEVILGYENAYGQKPGSPTVPAKLDTDKLLPAVEEVEGAKDLGCNGSYMVIRKLRQNTKAFKTFLRVKGGDNEGQERLAAKLVGRWPSGAPLALCPEKDDPRLGEDRSRNNCFGYAQDPQGMRCPLGSHIRRANPRDGLIAGDSKTSLQVVARHQLIRRGRLYSETHGAYGGREEGLFFIAINANIQRQFEFIQHTWLNNPKFGGHYDSKDPIVGDNPELPPATGPGVMTIPRFPVSERIDGVTRFVEVRGGGYFFLPGIRALRFLSQLK